ncbi:type IV secretory system conjugative DNA transfer family protein [Fodinicola acaciae]|uniref:type IV secretory system conjugative DNA transfer family protein n=1 Tax=Fodinicola acaciae TaxID=2681555 RepID=UPI0013D2F7D2|nr:type IV secretory system conjugative DNA transfer family protein [Fodinicola acaciae]
MLGHTTIGRRVAAGISQADARHHLHVLGPTGVGKSTLLANLALQEADAGRGIAVLDPKGDLVRDILDRLPASCGDRLVLIDPDDEAALPAINLLDLTVAGGSAYRAAGATTAVMAKLWHRWWGHRSGDIAYHAALTLAHADGGTLGQMSRLLSDHVWRRGQVRAVRTRLGPRESTLGEFWNMWDQLPPGARLTLAAPLQAKLRAVLGHPLPAGLFGLPRTTFSFDEILDGGILLARLPTDDIGADTARLVGSMLLTGLLQAAGGRARQSESARLDATLILDEAQNFLHLPIGVDDALAQMRGFHVSLVIAHQLIDQFTENMQAAVDGNARNKIFFTLEQKDAAEMARHVRPFLDEIDLRRMDAYTIALRAIAHARPLPPVTLRTLPPIPPVPGRAEQLRKTARERTGISPSERERLYVPLAANLLAVDDLSDDPNAASATLDPMNDMNGLLGGWDGDFTSW